MTKNGFDVYRQCPKMASQIGSACAADCASLTIAASNDKTAGLVHALSSTAVL